MHPDTRPARPVSVRGEVVVPLPPERAFALYADTMDAWWPRQFKIGPAALASVSLEPRAGGRWYEIGSDGSTCEWGRVIVYEPGRRLVLDWQISADWTFDPSLHTTIEVTFTAEGAGTRVRFEHRDLERFGDAAEAMRESFEGGMPVTFGSYAEAARQAAERSGGGQD